VNAVDGTLVAAFAQGNAQVLHVLFDVVSIAWPRLIAHATWHFLDPLEVRFFFGCWLVVHA
jgi:hypothetical protein